MPAAVSSQMRRLTGKPADLVLDVAVDGLLSVLAQITDPRSRFGRRYPLSAVLALAVCAVTCDANGFTAIAQWAADLSEEQLARFGLRRGRYTGRIAVPAERTFRLVLARVDPGELLEAAGRYVTHRLEQAGMAKIPERVTKGLVDADVPRQPASTSPCHGGYWPRTARRCGDPAATGGHEPTWSRSWITPRTGSTRASA